MTVCRFLSIFYQHAHRFERFRDGKGLTPEEHVAMQKREAALSTEI
jgi:hypothetical protein